MKEHKVRFPRSLNEFGEILDLTVQTKVKHVLGTCLVAFLIWGMIFLMVEGNSNRDLAREQRSNDVQTYQAELRVYDTQIAQIAQCNARYEGRQAARALFIAQNNTVRSILTLLDEASPAPTTPLMLQLFAELDRQDVRIAETYPPDEKNTCPPPPTLPVVPDSIKGDAEDETGDPRGTTPTTVG